MKSRRGCGWMVGVEVVQRRQLNRVAGDEGLLAVVVQAVVVMGEGCGRVVEERWVWCCWGVRRRGRERKAKGSGARGAGARGYLNPGGGAEAGRL